MGVLSELEGIVNLNEDMGKPSNHSANTSMLYAFATNKWSNKPVAQAFAEAETASGKPELESVLAEKYSSIARDIPTGVIEQYITPEDAVGVQSQIQADVGGGDIVEKLGSDAITDTEDAANKERIINAFAEWSHKNDEGTNWVDYATLLVPGKTQFALKAMFDDMGAESMKNLSAVFRASDSETQLGILKDLLAKFDTVSGYNIEKKAILSDMFAGFSANDQDNLNTFGLLDAAGVLPVGTALSSIKKAGGVVSTLRRADKAEEVGKAGAAAIKSDTVAKRNGEVVDDLKAEIISNDRVKATGSSEIVKELNGGAAVITDINESVNDIARRVTAEIDDLILSENFDISGIKAGLKDPDKGIAPIKQMAMEEFGKSYAKIARDGSAPVPVAKIKSFDAHTGVAEVEFSFKGKVKGTKYNKDGSLSKRGEVNMNVDHTETRTVTLGSDVHSTLDDLKSDVTTTKHFLASPKYKFETFNGTTVNRMVENAGLDQRASEKFVGKLQDELYGVLKRAGIHTKGARRMKWEKAVKQLDNENKLANVDELMDKYHFDSKQVKAYFEVQKINDIVKSLEDHTRFRTALLNGTKTVNVNDVKVTGRSFKNMTSASKALREAQYLDKIGNLRVKSVYDVSLGRYVSVHKLGDMKGKRVVVLDDDMVVKLDQPFIEKARTHRRQILPQKQKTTRNTRLLIVPKESVGELTREATKTFQRQSYSKIIRPDAKYFVKETSVRNVDGLDLEYKRTAAGFDNKVDAEAYLAKRKEQHAKGELTDVKSVDDKVFYDRESRLGGGFDNSYISGNARASKHEVEWMGVTNKTQLDPIQAISRNLSVVGDRYINNEWRSSILKKWQNSVHELDPDHSGHINDGVNTATEAGRNLEEMRIYIKSKFGVPSDETIAWESFTKRVAEWIESRSVVPNSNPVSRALRRYGSHNPYSYIKYATYQTMLGMFNPSQLMVQAQNMTLAASMFPGLTGKSMKQSMALKWHMASDYRTLHALNKAGKLTDETLDIIKQFKRAGLDNVNTNADIDVAMQGLGTTRGLAKSFLQSGTIFYRHGELSSRSVLYNVARQKFMDANKITNWKKLTEEDHRRIIEVFDNISLNLNSNNKTWFQQGAASVPTQFWHVQSKFIEALFGKSFTPQEKVRLLVGQVMIYGAAGVPGGYAIADFLQKRNPDGSGNIVGFDAETFKGGMMNWLFEEATGSGLQLSQRGALGYGFEQYFTGLFHDDNKEMWQKAMGASGELFRRGSYAWNICNAFAFAPEDSVNEPDLIDLVVAIGSMASSVANGKSAFDMYNLNAYVDKYSNRINFKDPTLVEIFGKAAGFTSTREATLWEDAKILRRYKEWKTDKANVFFQIMTAQGVDIATEAGSEWLYKSVPAYARMLGGDNDYDVAEIQKSIFRKLKDTMSKDKKINKQVLKLMGTSDLVSVESTGEEE